MSYPSSLKEKGKSHCDYHDYRTHATHLIGVNKTKNVALVVDLQRAQVSDPVALYEHNSALACAYSPVQRSLYVAHASPACIRIHRNLFPLITASSTASQKEDEHSLAAQASESGGGVKGMRLSHQTCVCEEAMVVLAVTHDAQYLIGGSGGGGVYVWHLLTGNLVAVSQHYHGDRVTALVPHSAPPLLFTSSRDATVHMVDLPHLISGSVASSSSNSPQNPLRALQGATIGTLRRSTQPLRGVLPFTVQGNALVAMWGEDCVLRVLDATSPSHPVEVFHRVLPHPVSCAVLDPVGEQFFIVATDKGEIYRIPLYDAEKGGVEEAASYLLCTVLGAPMGMYWSAPCVGEEEAFQLAIATREGNVCLVYVHFATPRLAATSLTNRSRNFPPAHAGNAATVSVTLPRTCAVQTAEGSTEHGSLSTSGDTIVQHIRTAFSLPFDLACVCVSRKTSWCEAASCLSLKLHPILRRFPLGTLDSAGDGTIPLEMCSLFSDALLESFGLHQQIKQNKKRRRGGVLDAKLSQQRVASSPTARTDPQGTKPKAADTADTSMHTPSSKRRKKTTKAHVTSATSGGVPTDDTSLMQLQAEVNGLEAECAKLQHLSEALDKEIRSHT